MNFFKKPSPKKAKNELSKRFLGSYKFFIYGMKAHRILVLKQNVFYVSWQEDPT